MKKILKLITLFFLFTGMFFSFAISNSNAGYYSDPVSEIEYCKGDTCGLEKGVELVKTSVKDIETDETATTQIQKIIIFLLGFVTLIATIYVIYAGFRILTSSGEDEVIKNSKKTIIYVIIGILIMWFAWTIANFAVEIGTGGGI